MNFDMGKLNNMKYEETTYTVDGEFENINLRAVECDIIFSPSDSGKCTVCCTETDKIKHRVSVKNNTLEITRTDNSKWYEHIGIFWGPQAYSITVNLPRKIYRELYISSVSGNISLPSDFEFSSVKLKSTSGDINFLSSAADEITAESTSGNINIENIRGDFADIGTVSGDITLSDIRNDKISVSSISGDITAFDSLAQEKISINSTSGNVILTNCDSEDIKIKTVSGDVRGTLLSAKKFTANTVSGDISLPDSISETQTCQITTTSGDISFSIK